MMVIDNKFNIGDSVYLKTDREQYERIITGMCLRVNGIVSYEVASGTLSTWHYEFELSNEKDILIKTQN